MRNFRADRLLPAALVLLVACARVTRVAGEQRNHPNAIVGVWVDSVKSSPTDSSFWLLSSSGDDAARRVRRAAADSQPHVEQRHFGYWYVHSSLTDTAGRSICFTNRPGRSAPTCIPFSLDSTRSGDRFVRRLVVFGYQGRHSSGARVLIAATAP